MSTSANRQEAILSMLSYTGCHQRSFHWLYWNSRTWAPRKANVQWKVMSTCDIESRRNRGLLKLILTLKSKWWVWTRIHYVCEDGIENFVPRDRHLSFIGKPRDANLWRWSSDHIFVSTLTFMMNFYIVWKMAVDHWISLFIKWRRVLELNNAMQ